MIVILSLDLSPVAVDQYAYESIRFIKFSKAIYVLYVCSYVCAFLNTQIFFVMIHECVIVLLLGPGGGGRGAGGFRGGGGRGHGRGRGGRDNQLLGKTIHITRGPYKGTIIIIPYNYMKLILANF